MPERCLDCLLDATHTLRWHSRPQVWSAVRFGAGVMRPDRTIHRYCKWHATVHATQRNARGVVPARQTRRLVGQPREEAR